MHHQYLEERINKLREEAMLKSQRLKSQSPTKNPYSSLKSSSPNHYMYKTQYSSPSKMR